MDVLSATKVNNPVPLGASLFRLLRSLGIDVEVKEHQVVAMWPEIAGERISKVSSADRVEGGVLFVKVRNSAWRNELVHFKPELLEMIAQKMGRGVIRDIKYI